MALVVQKYGGSSVSDLTRIRAVADRIARSVRAGDQVVAVVSAMGNTTNELLALARQVSDRPDRRELDMLVSVGERISMALLAMALRERGIPARSLTGSQSGIITDEAHADAAVVEVRPSRIRAVIESGEVAIVAGFQGVSREREVTTLGRGGSDTTAVVLAAALNADHAEICSDVDGVWSADPRVVPDAHRLDDLTLDEAVLLAHGGAKVLFEDAVRYAREHGVTIHATTTFGPGAGTTIRAARVVRTHAVAVTGDDQLVKLFAPAGTDLAPLRSAGARFRRRSGPHVWIDVRNAHAGLPDVEGVGVVGPAAVVTAVGSGLGDHLPRVDAATAQLPNVVAHGVEMDLAWWEVPGTELNEAVRRVHALLVSAR